jgi:predicted dienelactone hydrolase
MQTKSCISFVARATASLFLLLSAYPTMADVRCQDQCTEATETHLPVYLWQDAARRPKGIVLLLHGIGERAYSLNYLAQQLVSGGFVVYGLPSVSTWSKTNPIESLVYAIEKETSWKSQGC